MVSTYGWPILADWPILRKGRRPILSGRNRHELYDLKPFEPIATAQMRQSAFILQDRCHQPTHAGTSARLALPQFDQIWMADQSPFYITPDLTVQQSKGLTMVADMELQTLMSMMLRRQSSILSVKDQLVVKRKTSSPHVTLAADH